MIFGREIAFLASIASMALILHLVPCDEEKVALYRLEDQLRQEPTLKELVSNHCSTLEGNLERRDIRFLARLHGPQQAVEGAQKPCQIVLESSHVQRFYIQNFWNYQLIIRDNAGSVFFNRTFSVHFPRLLCLFPLAVFLLSLVFDFKMWGLAWTLGSYLFLLSGGNVIQGLSSVVRGAYLTFTANQTFTGLLLLVLWLSLYRSRAERAPSSRHEITRVQSLANRFLSFVVGLWNPAAYTLAGKLFFPFKGALHKIIPFLDGQLLITCISLYLLSLDMSNFGTFMRHSVALPRYFSFATFLFLSISYWSFNPRKRSVIWHQPRFWRGLSFVCAIELLSLQIAPLREFATLTRVGLALTLSEIISLGRLSLRSAIRSFVPLSGMLFIATFITFISVESGVMDLVLVAWEPRVHPTAVALFTFLAGLGLGFLTGSFSTTFFTVFALLVQSNHLPLVKAALIDGILAGSLLSPFSVFNLFPVAQFGIRLQELVRFRIKQLTAPLIIALIIYTVCAVNSVAILQPVTFVFLCLVAVTLQLKKAAWQLGQHTALKDSHSAAH